MKREDLIKQCRYYKGEKENPFKGKDQNKSMLWFYESCWVIESEKMNTSEDMGVYSDIIDEYIRVGLLDFNEKDGIPVSLKALLFNRYAKYAYSISDAVSSFRDFYNKYYKGAA